MQNAMQIIKIHGFNIGFNELWTCWKKRRFLKSLRGEGGERGVKSSNLWSYHVAYKSKILLS